MFISLMAAKGVSFTWKPWIFLNTKPASHGWLFLFFFRGTRSLDFSPDQRVSRVRSCLAVSAPDRLKQQHWGDEVL